ncbi:ribosomal protein S5 domain 2-type protein [Suillus clintonianus]|uniref:ribosomal protein S5 domain 2-type protein n=1 Tax=Suillus clintonianus TaxID=1904413 RepID=UPI001B864B61|nr:ribosomal protein S5 domain 2-type protein [Suillus clintonianus]KAG2153278.1 ribosomal protein S5 domain 2-type protein [Suillus clintonianus]
MSNLYSYVKVDRPAPKCLVTSQEIRDRGSAFVGSVYRASTSEEAKAAISHHRNVVHAGKKAYEISAWRCMMLKHGKTGLGGPDDFEVITGYNDDGEQWAGSKVLRVVQNEGVLDAVVIVSRWFGGTLLGPARFAHIETCAREVCRTFKRIEEMEECISTLIRLDNMLANLRQELNDLTQNAELVTGGSTSTPIASDEIDNAQGGRSRQPDYTVVQGDLDIAKAKRLIGARESAVKSVKSLLLKKRTILASTKAEG